MTQKIYQKQFSIGKILSESWKIFTENFQLILIITLIVYIPINIILSFFLIGESLEGLDIYLKVALLLEGFIGIIAMMAITYAIKSKTDGKSISVEESLKKSISKWGPTIGTNIILGMSLLGLTLLLIIPGIIFNVYWTFAIFAVVLNNKSGKDALKYSKKIVKGRWWTVAGYSIVFGMLGFIIGIIGRIPFSFLPENFLTNITYYTFTDILMSFFTVVSTVFYLNFEATKKTEVKE